MTRWPDSRTAFWKPGSKNAARRREFHEDRSAHISILAGRRPPRPDTLKQTDQPPTSTNPLADGAGHTFFERQPLRVDENPDRARLRLYPPFGQFPHEAAQRERRPSHAGVQQLGDFARQRSLLVAANLPRRDIARSSFQRPPLRKARRTEVEGGRYSADRLAALNSSQSPFPKIIRIGSRHACRPRSPANRLNQNSPNSGIKFRRNASCSSAVSLLGLRISCVPEVCGAFLGRVLSKDRCACVGDSVVCSGAGLSHQGFELGEHLLDRIEVGRVFRQEHKTRSCGSDRLSHDLSLVRAEIVQDHDIARLEGGREKLFDYRRGSVRR